MKLTLPTDSNERKGIPLYSGCYSYFPAALAGVAMHSKAGNDKHNPGEPLHHARGKSMDHADCIARHSMDLADMLAVVDHNPGAFHPLDRDCKGARDILAEARALSWRALAWHQELEERFGEAPLAPAARLPKAVPLCDLDLNHHGECVSAPAVGRSDSPAFDPQPVQCGQIPVPDRAYGPFRSPKTYGDPV